MKRVDGKLLEKYYAGRCTPEEKKMVQAWLQSGEYDEATDLPEDVKKSQKEQMWQHISNNITQQNMAGKPHYKNVMQYAAAACLAIVLFGTGYYYGTNGSQGERISDTADTRSQLHISKEAGKIAKVEGDQFQIRFNGFLRLYNASNSEMTIYSGEQSYVLQPSGIYYLAGSDKSYHLIKKSKVVYSLTDIFDRNLQGNYSILKS